jgi:hypothetical protein
MVERGGTASSVLSPPELRPFRDVCMIIIACEIMRQSNEVRSISAVCVLDSLPRDHGTSTPAPTIMEGVDAD